MYLFVTLDTLGFGVTKLIRAAHETVTGCILLSFMNLKILGIIFLGLQNFWIL